jgi:diguanylate cyclase (GGDEF)-like protein/PAS domain S-box-containing protein
MVETDAAGSAVPLEVFRVLAEESLTGVYLIQDGRLIYANRRLAEIFGFTRQEMLNLASVLEVIAEEDRALVEEKLRQRIAGEIDAIEYTVRGRRKDGQPIHLDVRSVRTCHDNRPAVMGSMLDITGQKRLEDTLRRMSIIDDLTGVYNRRGFSTLAESHLMLARRKKRELLLIFADVDDLKAINDRHGHAAGDQILRDAATVLRSTYRSADIIARLGGDEFTAFPLEADSGSASLLIDRLQEAVRAHNRTTERPYQLSVSVGVGRFDPEACQSVEQLLEEADRALYERKRRRKPGEG